MRTLDRSEEIQRLDDQLRKIDEQIKQLNGLFSKDRPPSLKKIGTLKWRIEYSHSSGRHQAFVLSKLERHEFRNVLEHGFNKDEGHFTDDITFKDEGEEARFIFHFSEWL